ncbi:hypothetical protein E2R51_14455 [Jeotgalibacillus sp. S-D1]|uniref:hypothetical protein n=1 Tax=Jeotgalibacillus sp. S-D1 TaxID=2552189 RepID=UPI00105A7CB9|nr:hypothetical protein [Jeotgalibacillus sp. S-D1]TDL31003.1 hypothetical protein E2R51_14455 [Jeotgalibacillus sp. S-D1]
MNFLFLFSQLQKRIKARTSFYTLFISSPELDDKSNNKKRKCYGLAAAIIFIYSVLLFLNIGNWIRSFLGLAGIEGVAGVIMGVIIAAIPIIFIAGIAIRYVIRLYPYSYNGIFSLVDPFIMDEFRGWIRENQYSSNAVEYYILPFVQEEIKEKRRNPAITFLEKVIPSFATNLPIAILMILFVIGIADSGFRENINEDLLNTITILFLQLTILVTVIGAFFYKSIIELLFFIFSETKKLRRLEQIIYAYLIQMDSPTNTFSIPPRKTKRS